VLRELAADTDAESDGHRRHVADEFGWYYEGGTVQGTAETLDDAIEDAALSDPSAMHRILIGPMKGLPARDLVDVEDVVELIAEHDALGVLDRVVDVASERADEVVEEGRCWIALHDRAAALEALLEWHGAHEQPGCEQALADWCDRYLQVEPSTYCDGEHAIPITLRDGVWKQERSEDEGDAVISYASEPCMETGEGWVWWAHGRKGSSATLADAKFAVLQALARKVGA
jgi:hypothetical protein